MSCVYLPLSWWLKTQFFESKLVVEKISCFEMTNFPALDTLRRNYIPRTEKRKKVPVCEMLESFGSFSSPMLLILSWGLRMLAYRGTSAIPPSFKLELLCQYKMTS